MRLKNACFALSMIVWLSTAYAQVTGSGTDHIIPIWTGTTTLADSPIVSDGGRVGIGTSNLNAKLTVLTTSKTLPAVLGTNSASSGSTSGVVGTAASPNGNGVLGINYATAGFSPGVMGVTDSPTSAGVYGYNATTTGYGSAVQGQIEASPGGAAGVFVTHGGVGLILNGLSGANYSQMYSVDSGGNGFYAGNLTVTGNLTKGSGSFKIDHPLDPANKYLSHSFVESPDMMNIYNGLVLLDTKGEASVILPDYFQALNSDFRYQLTAIGAPGPNLYVAEEISGNHFKIAGGKPGAKVSWQVTGIRQDAYAKAHRINVEEDKPEQQRGHYLHPELFGATEKEAIGTARPPAMTLPVPSVNVSEGNLR